MHHQGPPYGGGVINTGLPGFSSGLPGQISTGPPQYDHERDNELKKRLFEVMQKYGIKQVDVARDTNINHSSLSLWLRGKLEGHMARVPDAIETYLDNFMSSKPRINTMHLSKLNSLKQPNNRLTDNSLYDQPENQFGTLIPMKIELEIEGGQRLKELLLWDKNEPYMTIDGFARIFIEEHGLNSQTYEADIVAQMRRQIKEFRGYKIMTDQVPLSFIQQQQQLNGGQHLLSAKQSQQHLGPGHKMVSLPLEQIRTISINVRIGRVVYQDKFEWDVNNPDNSPEDFAECVCADLGLGDEFVLPIAHQIRERVLELQKVANSERRTKAQQTVEAEQMDKLEGSYAQIRSSTFPHAFNSASIGLPIEMFRDEHGLAMRTKEGITSHCEQLRTEQYYHDPLKPDQTLVQPQRTMIRSLDTLTSGTGSGTLGTKTLHTRGGGFMAEPINDAVEGWAPEVEILSEQDLKRIEKQEDRESRMRKRRTR